MRRFAKIFVSLFILVAATAGHSLAMEPFYKGEWGMSPAEIVALHNSQEPLETDNVGDGLIYTYATQTKNGLDFMLSYRFNMSGDGGLYMAWNSFRVDDTDFKAYEKLLAELTAMLEERLRAKGGFKYFTEKPEGGVKDGYQRNHTYWLGTDECIVMQSYWYGPTADKKPAAAFDIDFYSLADTDNKEYAEALKELKWRALK